MSRGAYDPKEDLSPELQVVRLSLRHLEKHRIVRYLDHYCYAEIVLEHIATKKSIWSKPDKVLLMMSLIQAYRSIEFEYVPGAPSFISHHFLVFAVHNQPQGGGEAGEELGSDIERAAKKRGLLSRRADPKPITRKMLEGPPTGWPNA